MWRGKIEEHVTKIEKNHIKPSPSIMDNVTAPLP